MKNKVEPMSRHVIRIIGFANGTPCPYAEKFVKAMNFDAHDGRGHLETTPDIAKAKKFPNFASALRFWKTQSSAKPWRPDGKPNRPLTATDVWIEPEPMEK